MDVGLEDVGEADAVLVEQGQHPVDVALRVDHEGDLAVVHEVAAVAERRGLDGDDGAGRTSQTHPHGATGGDPGLGAAGHGDGVEALGDEQVGHRLRAVARGADDVDAGRAVDLAEAGGELAHRHEDGAGHVGLGVLGALADVDGGAVVPLGGVVLDRDLGRLLGHAIPLLGVGPCC